MWRSSLFRRVVRGVGHQLSLLSVLMFIGGPSSAATPSWELPSEPIWPIPLEYSQDSAEVRLGERLFKDSQLSVSAYHSCASCDREDYAGANPQRHSARIVGDTPPRNAPSLFNVRFNHRFHWDGRHRALADAVESALIHPEFMGGDWGKIIAYLRQDDNFESRFRDVYDEPAEQGLVIRALVSYLNSLTTPNARFDLYLRGDALALSREEIEGFRLFKEYGCISCHNGINLGGNSFQRHGIYGDLNQEREEHHGAVDPGRFMVTGEERDFFTFRVPGLRNVDLTSPYLHDGSVSHLEEVVEEMAEDQLGIELPEADVALIVEFLKTLTGRYPGVER